MRVLLLLCVVLGGCDKWGKRLDTMEDWKDKVCACPDVACARSTENSFDAWWSNTTKGEAIGGGNVMGRSVDFVKVPADHHPRYLGLRDELRACVRRLGDAAMKKKIDDATQKADAAKKATEDAIKRAVE